MTLEQQVANLLVELTRALKEAELWQDKRPSDMALNSSQPFCIDTLDFHQWLQFIFIEKMHMLVNENLALPTELCLMPIAQEACKVYPNKQVETVLHIINRIDQLFA